jgi:hypothetical protein
VIRRRHLLAAAAGLALPRPGLAQGSGGALHALLIGIDAYRLQPLRGCVNDAELLARTLQPMAASVTLLRDREGSRAGFDRAWAAVTGRCRPGDRLLFAFSGHGSRKPEAFKGSEKDGMDDFLVLQPFHHVDAPTEMVIDNEMEQLLAALGRREVQVIFIADCCHAGTMTRSVDPGARRQHSVRTLDGAYPTGQLMQNLLSAPPPPPSPPQGALDHVVFFAAGQETEEVPEITWEGRRHGALSVAIATGLDGAADADRDGRITTQEMADHILRNVRGTADARQTPEVERGARAPAVLREIGGAPPPAPAPAPNPEGPPLRLSIEGTPPPGLAALPGVRRVEPGAEFDLLWRPETGQTVSALGDVIAAQGVTAALLPASIARLRALVRVQALVAQGGLEVRIEALRSRGLARAEKIRGDNAAHVKGTLLKLVVEAVRLPFFVLFSIAGDGTVQMLYPDPADPKERPVTPSGGRMVLDDIEVKAPYGTDRPVAVASDRPLEALATALKRLDGQQDPLAAVAAVERAIAGGQAQVGLAAVVTRER